MPCNRVPDQHESQPRRGSTNQWLPSAPPARPHHRPRDRRGQITGRVRHHPGRVARPNRPLRDRHHLGSGPHAPHRSAFPLVRGDRTAARASCGWRAAGPEEAARIVSNSATKTPVSAVVDLAGLPERSSDQPIEDIAHEVGYEDASFFRRLFRQETGITASAYRRQFGSIHGRAIREPR